MADTKNSKQLSSFLHHPGVFFTDNPYAHPHQPLDSEEGNVNAPFPCHIIRDAQKSVQKNYYAAHIIYGDTRAVKIGFKGKADAGRFNHVSGSAKLFTSHTGKPRTSDHNDSTGSDGDAQSGYCMQVRVTANQNIPDARGVLIGPRLPDEILLDDQNALDEANEVFDLKARWCSPLGVQFRWSSRSSNRGSPPLNFSRIGLVYMDNWMPGRTLYMPLVEAETQNAFGDFVNPKSYYKGSDPFNLNYSQTAGSNESQGHYGEVIAYAEPEVIDYMAAPYTRAVCVGMYMEFNQPNSSPSYNMGREIFDFKFLFDMPNNKGEMFASNSMFVYPAPYPLRDAFQSNNIKLL